MTQVLVPTGLVSPDRFMKETGYPVALKGHFHFLS
jgi:hypothetical protein